MSPARGWPAPWLAVLASCVLIAGCGGSSSPISAAYEGYSRALASGHPVAACQALSASIQAQILAAARRAGVTQPSCPSVVRLELDSLTEAQHTAQLALASQATVTVLSHTGSSARIRVANHLDGITEFAIAGVTREDGVWKVSALPTQEMSGTDLVYRVPSAAMEPTLTIGQTVLVDPRAYARHPPKVGDIVTLHPPVTANDQTGCANRHQGVSAVGDQQPQPCDAVVGRSLTDQTFIKRIVAGPGERMTIVDGHVVLNGRRESLPRPPGCAGNPLCTFSRAIRIPAGSWFVLGDNVGNSDDSREWGPIPTTSITGQVVRTLRQGTR